MVLAPNKRQLLTQQHDERATLLSALEDLNADYSKKLEYLRGRARQKAFTYEITRARRYPENKSPWEYLNNILEIAHLYTWRKTVVAICKSKYQRQRQMLEEELRDLEAQHRKERIRIRYESPSEIEEPQPNI